MDDLSRFCCLNSDCPEHGKRGAGNLTVTSRYGPGKERRMLRCRVLQGSFFRAARARHSSIPDSRRRSCWRFWTTYAKAVEFARPVGCASRSGNGRAVEQVGRRACG